LIVMPELDHLFPRPRRVERRPGACVLRQNPSVTCPELWRAPLAADLTGAPAVDVSITQDATLAVQGYRLIVDAAGVRLQAADLQAARYGLRMLRQLPVERHALPHVTIDDAPATRHRGVQIDLGRVLERPDTIERLLEVYASLNINVIQFYLENALEFPSHPRLARRPAWTMDQAQGVVRAAQRLGIGVIPAIQSLGHCHWIGSHPDYRDCDEGHETGAITGVLCPSQPRVLAMLRDMIRDVAPLATAGIIHLGMDESFSIGICSRCAERRRQVGEGGIFVDHANRVAACVREHGLRPAIWGDMFGFYPHAVRQLDPDVLIFDWYYYAFEHVPRIELFRFAEFDSLALWKQRGLDAWCCPWSLCTVVMPMNEPGQSIQNAQSWLRYQRQRGFDGLMCTQWELKATSIDLCPPIEGAVAAAAWEQDVSEPGVLLRRSCDHLFGRPQLAPWLEELGRYRFNGHAARRWLHAPNLASMITGADDARDGADIVRAERLEAMAAEVQTLAQGARRAASLEVLTCSASWAAYQYRKRSAVNQAAVDAVARRYADAAEHLRSLPAVARRLAQQWQAQWDRNRFADDPSATPSRLRDEAQWIDTEVQTLQLAAAGEPYRGALQHPVLLLEICNSHPGCPSVAVSSSRDGRHFVDRGAAWVLEFDNHAARPRSDEQLRYAFVLPEIADGRWVRVAPRGGGAVTLTGVRIGRGARQWLPRTACASGTIDDPSALLRGSAQVLMGHVDPASLFAQLQRQGNSASIFSHEHGVLTLEFDVDEPDITMNTESPHA
jgi:hypothetical protein